MKILLLNDDKNVNHIVEKISLHNEYDLKAELSDENFDVVIVDDKYYKSNDSALEINELDTECMIFLNSSNNSESLAGFDYELKKPFLPKELISIIKQDNQEISSNKDTFALNIKDIDEIKELLEDKDDELEKFMNKMEMDLKEVWNEISIQGRG